MTHHHHSNQTKTYHVLGILLSYPSAQLIVTLDKLSEVLEQEGSLSSDKLKPAQQLMHQLRKTELLELEERYVILFDHRPKLSLYLFEHTYAESPDRGQAMIDLLAQYRKRGLDFVSTELPDYLPVFLEYLSILPENEARTALAQHIDTFSDLSTRLKKQNSLYHTVFDALVALSSRPINKEQQ